MADRTDPPRRRSYRRRTGGAFRPEPPGGWEGVWWSCPREGCGYGERGAPGGGPLGSGVCEEHNVALRADPADPAAG